VARGGEGPAAALNDAVRVWPGVRVTPMFGRWGYFRDSELFGCFPLRPRERDLWIRLAPDDAARACRTPGIAPHRRMAAGGWVELRVEAPRDVGRAIRWLRRGYERLGRTTEREEESER
jgi:hypothetical protein